MVGIEYLEKKMKPNKLLTFKMWFKQYTLTDNFCVIHQFPNTGDEQAQRSYATYYAQHHGAYHMEEIDESI